MRDERHVRGYRTLPNKAKILNELKLELAKLAAVLPKIEKFVKGGVENLPKIEKTIKNSI